MSAYIPDTKGVKVCSAIHHQIRKHAKQNLAEYFAFSIHRWSTITLYNVCNLLFYTEWIYKIMFSFRCFEKSLIFEIFVAYPKFEFFLKPGGSVYVTKDHIRWITSPFSFSLSVMKVLIKAAITWQCLYVGYPHLHNNAQNFNWVLHLADQFFRCKVLDIKLSWLFLFWHIIESKFTKLNGK